ncbi:hypothetical protein ACFLWB_03060, partial [Chloroflexota bacterium]
SSTLKGLYAAGFSSPISGGGIGGIAQSHGFVSGYRAGEQAARACLQIENTETKRDQVELLRKQALSPLGGDSGPQPEEIYLAINRATLPLERSFFKHEKGLKATLTEIRRVKEELLPRVRATDVHGMVKANEARNFVALAEVLYLCCLERQESRGGLYRVDFPYRDDINWLKWIIIKNDGRKNNLNLEPVPLEKYPVKLEQRSLIPTLLQVSLQGKPIGK